MADTNAYIQKLMDKEGNDVYPITTASAVFVQTKSGDVISQQTLENKLASMESSFQAGCDTLVNKLKALGVTPASSSPSDIAAAMDTLATNKYNAGVTAADARVNKSSASYSQGVTDADARTNTSSASYSAGRSQGQADVKANPGGYGLITQDAYNNYGTTCYNNGVAAGKAAVSGSVSASASWSGSVEGDWQGVKAGTNGSVTVTASISSGKLTVSASGTSVGQAWLYKDGEGFVNEVDCSRGISASNSKQVV